MVIDLHQDISTRILGGGLTSFFKDESLAPIKTYGKFGLVDQVNSERLETRKFKFIVGASCPLTLDRNGVSVPSQPLEELETHLKSYRDLINKSRGKFWLVQGRGDLDWKRKGIGLVLSIEGLYCVTDRSDLEMVKLLFAYGVRIVSLTWNISNALGGGGQDSRGLTDLGRVLVKKFNQTGIIIDGVHASHKSLKGILDVSSRPILVSHALSRNVFDSPRNLEDTEVKQISLAGGLVGICFVANYSGNSSIDQIILHLKHLIKVGSIEAVAIGSDFGAMFKEHLVNGLEQVGKIDGLWVKLRQAGFKSSELDKIMWENAFNFLKLNLPA